MTDTNFEELAVVETEADAPHVLIVDDDADQLEMLADVTRGILVDWTIESARSESEAYSTIERLKGQIAAAIVDLRLTPPDADDGIRVLKRLREDVPGCFNVLVSMRARDSHEIQEALAGERPGLVDETISLRFIDTDPVSELQSALSTARRRFEEIGRRR